MKYKDLIKRMFKVGEKKIKISPSKDFKVSELVTREKVRKAIVNHNVIILDSKSTSRKKDRKLTYNKKTKRMLRVRSLRKFLLSHKAEVKSKKLYRNLYLKVKSGIILTKKKVLELIKLHNEE